MPTLSSWSLLLVAPAVVLAACGTQAPDTPPARADFALAPDALELCLPNNDGVVERQKVNFITGLSADVVANPPGTLATFDPRGRLVDGQLEWDLSTIDGVVAPLRVEAARDFWFAKHFPDGEIAMGTTVKADTLQVLRAESDRVLLLGLASRQPEQTLLVYSPPVVAMRFPMQVGQSFTSSSELKDGSKLNGLPFYSQDSYEIRIDVEGMLRLPHLRLHRVLRLETLVTIHTFGNVTKTTRQLQWFTECYGEVARALSQTDEKEALFTQATELRRLAL